jgi:hypothetical protein
MTIVDGHMNGLTDQENAAVRAAARISAGNAPAVTSKTAQLVGDLLNAERGKTHEAGSVTAA